MMHMYTADVLAKLPIAKDNSYVRIDKYGRDRSADFDVYVLTNEHWVWVKYAWTLRKARWYGRQLSYENFTATMVVGNNNVNFFAYGKEVSACS